MENVVSLDTSILLGFITPEQLEALSKAMPEKAEAIKQALAAKAKVDKALQDRQDFLELLGTIELPEPPEGVLNIYNSFIKETRKLIEAEKEEVLKANPKVTKEELDTRQVFTGQMIWTGWQLNKSMAIGKGDGGTAGTKARTRKLAVTIYTREGTSLSLVGNFRTSKEACDHFKLVVKGDSARRVLEAHHFVVDDYEGEDYLIKS